MGLLACFTTGLLGCLLAGPLMSGVRAEECRPNWLAYRGHCYGYFARELTWQQAETQCRRSGGHLASILDIGEHQAIAQYLQRAQRWGDDDEVWFGLSVRGQSREWTWADGSPVGYTAWEKFKSPFSLEGEHCAALEESAGFMLWDKDSCYDKNPFVCKV